MTLQEIRVGDVVRVDDDPRPWRVEGRTSEGMLTLDSLHSVDRVVWAGVYEFRVQRAGAFA